MADPKSTCRHCGRPIIYLGPEHTVRNGWAHVEVQITPTESSPLEEPCRINPRTLNNARGTKFAEPVEAGA